MRKRVCVSVAPYSAEMKLVDRSKSDRIVDKGFYSPYCTAENYPFATAQMLVDAANQKTNQLSQLTAFKRYTQSGQNLLISCHKVTELNRSTISWALALTRENMHTLYEQSEWGWSEKIKMEELTNKKAWYLIVRTAEGQNVAFVHFRFDLDYGIEVLYCYEIQLNESVRRVGLGQYLMLILELIAKQNRMKKVMLTVFKHNVVGRNFFAKKLRYEVDETSPSCRRTSYEILSKKIIYRPDQNNYRSNRSPTPDCAQNEHQQSPPIASASASASARDIAPKIKAILSHVTASVQAPHSVPDHSTLSQPNLEYAPNVKDKSPQMDEWMLEPNLERATDKNDDDRSSVPVELLEPNLECATDKDKDKNDEERFSVPVELLEPNLNADVEKTENGGDEEMQNDLDAPEK